LLRQLSNSSENICIQAFSNSVSWIIYLEQGKIIYASHSVEPFDRLERHLRRLAEQIPQITSETRVQLRMTFELDSPNQSIEYSSNSISQPAEYQAIYWLVNQQNLNSTQTALLVQELVIEVIESFLLIKEGTYQLTELHNIIPLCSLDTEKISEHCHARLTSWQSLVPKISSPYQRPYLLIKSKFPTKDLPELQPDLTNWMKGFSLRHLAVIMNQDEIQLTQSLYPHIMNGAIILHEPDPPFDKLPKIFTESLPASEWVTEWVKTEVSSIIAQEPRSTITKAPSNIIAKNIAPVTKLLQISAPFRENLQEPTLPNNINPPQKIVTAATATTKKVHKIVSVDDSPTILKEISRFLESENFSVVTINDPLKAIMSIIRHKPDLILLDLNMAGVDGYELCRIIRNNSKFKATPIIFVTGNKGIVDKVKAKLVGASGYLTKPFTRAELLKIVFMHLL
jgi:twitching motility two-component system response regulator PilG